MSNLFKDWDSTLNLKNHFDLYRNDEIEISELGKRVSKEISRNRFCDDITLQWIAEDFEDVQSVNEFDECLAQLYDFGDAGKAIWVQTR